MRKFLLGILVGLVLACVSGVVFFYAALRFADRKPALPAQGTLVLRLEGPIPEGAPVEVPFPMFEDRSPATVAEIWQALEWAAQDNRIRAVWLEPRFVQAGWGKLEELRAGIEKVRKAGKPVYAVLDAPGMREYFLATAADRIFMTPEDLLDVKGLRIEAMYFKGTLDKLGVSVEVEHVGRFKDAGDTLVRDSMSPETREVLDSVLDTLYARIVTLVSAARKKTPDEMRALIDQGPFLATAAKKAGLVDSLAYRDQVEKELMQSARLSSMNRIALRDYLRAGGPASRRSRIALVVAQGDILRSSAGDFFGEGQFLAPGPLRRQLRMVADDPSIRGVIIRVDSPGGDAVASDEMLQDLRELSRKKPVVFSFSDVAASGGYYLAMTGDPLVAYPGTLTGSIGVLYGKANLKGLYDKLGISKDILKRGHFADIDSDVRPLTPESRKKLQEGLQSIYDGFLKRVSEGRRRPVADIDKVAQGRVWLGTQAREVRLVDELGGLDAALQLLRKKANLSPGEPVRLIPYPGRRSIFDQLLAKRTETEATAEFSALRTLVQKSGIAPWLTGGYLRVMPFAVEIR